MKDLRKEYDEHKIIKEIMKEGEVESEKIKLDCYCGGSVSVSKKELVKDFLDKGFIKLDCSGCDGIAFSIKEALYLGKDSKLNFKFKDLNVSYEDIHNFCEHPEKKISSDFKKVMQSII